MTRFTKKTITTLIVGLMAGITPLASQAQYRFVASVQDNHPEVETQVPNGAAENSPQKSTRQQSATTPAIPQDQTLLKFLNKNDKVNQEEISKETHHFYTQNNYAAVWFPNGQKTKAAEVALAVLGNSYEEGLNPEDYIHASKIDYNKNWVEAEIALTNTFLKFIHDVRVGRIPPNHLSRTIKIVSPETKSVEALTDALRDSANNFANLNDMAPDLECYKKLKSLLASYRQLAKDKDNKELPTLKKHDKKIKLKLGQSNAEVVKLKQILYTLGFLADAGEKSVRDQHVLESVTEPDKRSALNQQVMRGGRTKAHKKSAMNQQVADDLEKATKKSVLDQHVMDALKEFQQYHSLDDDGALGPESIKALNWSMDDRIKKIIVNMERLRWLPDHLGKKFIIVNVGGYEVLAVKNGKVEHRIKAIVGRKDRRTPLFYAPMKNVIINPSWGVPTSIMVRDKIPKMRRDPGYAARAGFTVTDSSGNRVDPYQVNWESEGSSMHLRQSPGAHNALGRIKFNIENPYTIYLHGTPEDKLFKRGTRNFSSGCIRLQQPTALAEWILKDVNGWGVNDIEHKVKAGRTQSIPIKSGLPVYFTYMTVWVDDKGKSHFSPDAYDMDDALIKALNIKTDVPLQVAVGQNHRIRYA